MDLRSNALAHSPARRVNLSTVANYSEVFQCPEVNAAFQENEAFIEI